MSRITVTAKGNFGYHPASGNYLHQGEEYTIEEDVFSDALFELKPVAPAVVEAAGVAVEAVTTAPEGGVS